MGNPLQMVSVDTSVLSDELPPGARKRMENPYTISFFKKKVL